MITNYDVKDNYRFFDDVILRVVLCGLISLTSLVAILISKDSVLWGIDSIIDYNTGVIWAVVDTFGFIKDLVQAISIILGSEILEPSSLSSCFTSLMSIEAYIVSKEKNFVNI